MFDAELQCRDALRVIEEAVPPEACPELRQEIAALDERLYALYESPPARTGSWWNEAYPLGIINTGPRDLVGAWETAPSKKHGGAVDELCLREDRTFTARSGHRGGPSMVTAPGVRPPEAFSNSLSGPERFPWATGTESTSCTSISEKTGWFATSVEIDRRR